MQDATDFASWPVKELRRFLQEHGVDTTGIVEKPDLVARAQQASAARSDVDFAAAPPGYVFDPSSGYFYNSDTCMYWHKSGSYYSSSTGLWYSFDGSKFVQCSVG